MFTQLGGKVARGPWMKRLDFGGNLNHATLWSGLQLVGAETYPTTLDMLCE